MYKKLNTNRKPTNITLAKITCSASNSYLKDLASLKREVNETGSVSSSASVSIHHNFLATKRTVAV